MRSIVALAATAAAFVQATGVNALIRGSAALGSSAGGVCMPAPLCQYSVTVNGRSYHFDISSGCHSTDYTAVDGVGHRYAANICGTASTACNPKSWTNTQIYGNAVQSWGGTPSCNKTAPECNDPTQGGKAVCCTADCQLIDSGKPTIRLANPSNPLSGGLLVTHEGAQGSDSDPFWCDFNEKTGVQFPRRATYHLMCDPSATSPVLMRTIQNATDDCRYSLFFKWAAACGGPLPHNDCVHGTMSGGSCICENNWTGPACNTSSLVCASDSTCSVCKSCCVNYPTATCEACVADECSGRQVCEASSSCTTCAACCKDYLKGNQEACDACAMTRC